MPRDPRWVQEGGGLDEVTCVVIQNRYLLRPSDELNDLVLGVIGYAQRQVGMRICGLTVLSSHYHILLWPEDAEQRADFMCLVNTNLAKEVGRLHGWQGTMFPDRYHSVPVSDEEAAQIARRNEGIPGGSAGGVLSPLPCWAHLPEEEIRRRARDLVDEIAQEEARERARTGRRSQGAAEILRAKPHHRPKEVEGSNKPRFHAASASAFKRMWEAYREVIAAFREASVRLLEGDLEADFPEGTFPPGLPFVAFPSTVLAAARGQPS